MDRYRLESKVRNIGIAYLLFFFVGAHYAYLKQWGLQILFWITFGGLGIWWLIDLIRMSNLVDDYNDPIFDELDWMDEQDRKHNYLRDLERNAYARQQKETLWEER